MGGLLFSLLVTTALGPSESQWAIVATNNRSLALSRPDLRYADDDGAKYAGLFADYFGLERVTLLTDFDPELAPLYGDWPARSQSATRSGLAAALRRVSNEVAEARAQGRRTSVFVVLAGHGDLADGQGFFELRDGPLRAAALEAMLKAVPADRIHLVIDSCNAYFMLDPRKVGARRFVVRPRRARSLLDRLPNVGAVLSTSAEAVTYEWSEIQSGIFSHEIRSALRGAGDADGDGALTYDEVAAFVETANERVKNPLFRPKVFAQAPKHDAGAPLLRWPESSDHTLWLGPSMARRITLRDANGVRLADAHKAAGTSLLLQLPTGPEAIGVYEQTPPPAKAGRPGRVHRVLQGGGRHDIDALLTEAPRVVGRGEAPVLQDLFASPFGPASVTEYRARLARAGDEVVGVAARDVARLARYLDAAAEAERAQRIGGGLALSGLGLGLGVAGGISARQANDGPAFAAMLAGGAMLVGAGGLQWARPSRVERVRNQFRRWHAVSGVSAAEAMSRTLEEMERLVGRARRMRPWSAGLQMGFGAALATSGLAFAVRSDGDGAALPSVYTAGVGLALLGAGLWAVVDKPKDAVERVWDLYHEEDGPSGGMALSLGAVDRGVSFGLSGRF